MKPFVFDYPVIYAGNPTGQDEMLFLGEVEGAVTLNANLEVYHQSIDRKGAIPIVGTGYDNGAAPSVTVPLIGQGAEALQKIVATAQAYKTGGGGTPATTGITALGRDPKNWAKEDYVTVAIVPRNEAKADGNGTKGDHVAWLPLAFPENPGDVLSWKQVTSDDYAETHEVTFHAVYTAKDQSGSEIPKELRRGFIGPVADESSLTWKLPTYDGTL